MGKWKPLKKVWVWASHIDTLGSIATWVNTLFSILVASVIGFWSFFDGVDPPVVSVLFFAVFALCFILFKNFLAWWSSREISTPQDKKETIQVPESATTIETPKVERDVWLLHAVHYIAFGSSEFVEIPLEEVQLTAGHQAQDEIRQKAFDGSLPVWGIIGSGGLFKPIPKEYWEHHYLKALIFAINDPEGFCTKGNGLESDHTIYNSLMTSKAKVEELWPVVNT